ncbi:hypothetical protein [Microbulbifer sp. JMSA003]|uniref:hypothetical protein n=1 Tax=Microbulbifer sp. JMSA003 TaxID=3243369 RepID=UPI00403A355E
MGRDIHLYVETSFGHKEHFSDVAYMRAFAEGGSIDIARNRELFGLLYSNKGLPNILSDEICREFYNYVREPDENLRTLDYIDRKDADKIIAEGRGHYRSLYGQENKWISETDWHSPSYLTLAEVLQTVETTGFHFNRLPADFRVVIKLLEALEGEYDTVCARIVFWFDN